MKIKQKSASLASLCDELRTAVRPEFAAQLIQSYRAQRQVQIFLHRLACALARRFRCDCSLHSCLAENERAPTRKYFVGMKGVSLRFRVFEETASVFLPSELVAESLARYERRIPDVFLADNDSEQLTILTYFFASILAEEALFRDSRVYITDVQQGTFGNMSEEPPVSQAFQVQLAHQAYHFLFLASEGFVHRLRARARMILPHESLERFAASAKKLHLPAALSGAICSRSLRQALLVTKGDFFKLPKRQILKISCGNFESAIAVQIIGIEGQTGVRLRLVVLP